MGAFFFDIKYYYDIRIMKKIFFTICFLLSLQYTQAQASNYSSMSDLTEDKILRGGDIFVIDKLKNSKNIEATGNTYLSEKFIKGSIEFKDGKKYEAMLRLDIFNQTFEIKNNDGKITPISINENVEIYLDEQRYTMHSVMLGEKGDLAILKDIVVNEDLSLYFLPRKVLELPNERAIQAPSSGYSENKQKAKWKEAHLYLIKSNGNYIEIPKSHKKMSLLGIFNEKEYKSFRKQNKIDLKNEDDLKKLVNYFSK